MAAESLRHSDKISKEIHESTLRKLKLFDSLRGKDVKKSEIPFWDVVVVTAVDKKQLFAYELQIEAKLSRGELPNGVIYKVVSDPAGPKIGNGGATLHAIEELEKGLGAEFLSQCKILMIHAGGFSQRLPSASVLGKIFTAVPYGKYTMYHNHKYISWYRT
jgi:fucose-1-phosphate guanylyltransferase